MEFPTPFCGMTEETRAQPQKIGLKNGFDSHTRTIAARVVVKADLPFRALIECGRSLRFETSRT